MQYRNYPFGAGNARNKFFWGAVIIAILVAMSMFARRMSKYEIMSGKMATGHMFSVSGDGDPRSGTGFVKLEVSGSKKKPMPRMPEMKMPIMEKK